MKTVYIPKGETVHYESLATEHLVVHGRLHVTYGVKAQSITGSGVIDAGNINADTVCIDDVESGTDRQACAGAGCVCLRECRRVLLPLRSLCGNGKADGSDQRGG